MQYTLYVCIVTSYYIDGRFSDKYKKKGKKYL